MARSRLKNMDLMGAKGSEEIIRMCLFKIGHGVIPVLYMRGLVAFKMKLSKANAIFLARTC